ncbi:MerR family transcriptional regulator [Sinorhizobium fredii]|uniref:MerR family transcriptional regulator n=1 Tax=Rhizobium fredii TaxID=380 RepID=UPI0005956630|nr:MerR family transcriptional regulator [Sinorhizobium fredii]WOS65410.1 MerR family transcriptional regulator [Sinorhizobium fredii GR64]
MRDFGVSEVARLLDVEPGAIRIWRSRGICRFGLVGDAQAARYTPADVLVMAWALALKTAGFDLRVAFDVAEANRIAANYILAGQAQGRAQYLLVQRRPSNPKACDGYRFGDASIVLNGLEDDSPVNIVINATKIAADLFGRDGILSRLDAEAAPRRVALP